MSMFMGDFAHFGGVEYKFITHLYWNRFPYKVVLSLPPYKDTVTWAKWIGIKNQFLKKIVEPGYDVDYTYRVDTKTTSYFFVERAAAEEFATANLKSVCTIFAPRSPAEITACLSDAKVRIREILFYGTYRWMVAFHPHYTNEEAIKHIDTWVENYFDAEDRARYGMSYGAYRTLYLAHESDVIVVKMALAEHIRVIERALLPEEVRAA